MLHPGVRLTKRVYKQSQPLLRKNEHEILLNYSKRLINTTRFLINLSRKSLLKIFKVIFLQRSTLSTFAFAYIFEVLPKLLSSVIHHLFQLKLKGLGNETLKILTDPLDSQRLPIFMTKLVATLNAFTPIYSSILLPHMSNNKLSFYSSFLAAFTSALLNFPSFQHHKLKHDRYYTLDWTLILVTRALDTLIISNFKSIFHTNLKTAKTVGTYGDIVLFVSACFFIMDSWFFEPEKLTPHYAKWITKASHVDENVLLGIRYLRDGELDYHPTKPLPHQNHFKDFCIKYNKDPKLGDLNQIDKIPCEILHQFTTKSCWKHVLILFWVQFKFAFKLYATLNTFLFVFIKKFRGSPLKYLYKTIRSASFLGAFTGIHWAAFCFIRNYHPNWFGQKFWDILAPKAGSALCGTSILLEYPSRRNELSLFVLPKALWTFIDPTTTESNIATEVIAFSLSFAVLIAYARLQPSKLRGLVGKGLSYMVKH